MRAIVITGTGGPEVLEVRDVPTPEPQGDQVRVRVRACGLNRADLMQARGMYPAPPGVPADIPGLEFAGEVDALGPDVTGPLKVGDRVFGIVGGGGQAEYVVTHERMAVPIPANLDFEEAAAVPEAFITAHDALLTQGASRPGRAGLDPRRRQRRRHGGRPARPRDGLHRLRHLADGRRSSSVPADSGSTSASTPRRTTSPRSSPTATDGAGVDVVIDLIGGPALAGNWRALATRGRLVLVGLLGGGTAPLDLSSCSASGSRSSARRSAPGRSRRRSPPPGGSPTGSSPGWSRGLVRPVVDQRLRLRGRPRRR